VRDARRERRVMAVRKPVSAPVLLYVVLFTALALFALAVGHFVQRVTSGVPAAQSQYAAPRPVA
jgi:hypothetical protein